LDAIVPRIRVTLAPEALTGLSLSLDYEPLGSEALADWIRLNAGRHVIEARATGYATERLEFEIRDGQATQLRLLLSPASETRGASATSERGSEGETPALAATAPHSTAPHSSARPIPTGTWILGSVAAASVVGATYSGLQVLALKDSERRSDIERAVDYRLAANVSWAVAGGAGIGALLWYLLADEPKETESGSARFGVQLAPNCVAARYGASW
jgi:hypothetical protein